MQEMFTIAKINKRMPFIHEPITGIKTKPRSCAKRGLNSH
jgi:hypothetical protein